MRRINEEKSASYTQAYTVHTNLIAHCNYTTYVIQCFDVLTLI